MPWWNQQMPTGLPQVWNPLSMYGLGGLGMSGGLGSPQPMNQSFFPNRKLQNQSAAGMPGAGTGAMPGSAWPENWVTPEQYALGQAGVKSPLLTGVPTMEELYPGYVESKNKINPNDKTLRSAVLPRFVDPNYKGPPPTGTSFGELYPEWVGGDFKK